MPLGQAINNVRVCIYTSMYHARLFALTSDATAQLSGTSKQKKAKKNIYFQDLAS